MVFFGFDNHKVNSIEFDGFFKILDNNEGLIKTIDMGGEKLSEEATRRSVLSKLNGCHFGMIFYDGKICDQMTFIKDKLSDFVIMGKSKAIYPIHIDDINDNSILCLSINSNYSDHYQGYYLAKQIITNNEVLVSLAITSLKNFVLVKNVGC